MNVFALDDANFTSLRRSIFIYAALTFLIAEFEAHISLPPWPLVSADGSRIEIPHDSIMWGFLIVQIYLLTRFLPSFFIERASLVAINVDALKEQNIDLGKLEFELGQFLNVAEAAKLHRSSEEIFSKLESIYEKLAGPPADAGTFPKPAKSDADFAIAEFKGVLSQIKNHPKSVADFSKILQKARQVDVAIGKFGEKSAGDISRGIQARSAKLWLLDGLLPLGVCLYGIYLSGVDSSVAERLVNYLYSLVQPLLFV